MRTSHPALIGLTLLLVCGSILTACNTSASSLSNEPSLTTSGDRSDIEVLNVNATSLQAAGKIYIEIRNNGPQEFNGTLRVSCTGTSVMRAKPEVKVPIAAEQNLAQSIGLGTGTISTSLTIDPTVMFYPVIQCIVSVPNGQDPNPANNIGAINIP